MCPSVSMTSLARTESQDSAMTTEDAPVGRLTRVFAGGDQSFACISIVSVLNLPVFVYYIVIVKVNLFTS